MVPTPLFQHLREKDKSLAGDHESFEKRPINGVFNSGGDMNYFTRSDVKQVASPGAGLYK
jgi:hypothetical protein